MAKLEDERENAKMCRRDETQTQTQPTNQPTYQSRFYSCFIFAISLAIGLRMLFNVAYAQCLQIHENTLQAGEEKCRKTLICQPAAAMNISSTSTYFVRAGFS